MIVKVLKYKCPCGWLLLGENEGDLLFCDWIKPDADETFTGSQRRLKRMGKVVFVEGNPKVFKIAIKQLEEYFSGKRKEFNIPFSFCGTTFQKKVWEALTAIPYGTTTTYAEIAGKIGKPKSVRAVANAIGANPLSVIVPCHRVIGSTGSLTGYAGGLPTKRFLLSIEAPTLFNESC